MKNNSTVLAVKPGFQSVPLRHLYKKLPPKKIKGDLKHLSPLFKRWSGASFSAFEKEDYNAYNAFRFFRSILTLIQLIRFPFIFLLDLFYFWGIYFFKKLHSTLPNFFFKSWIQSFFTFTTISESLAKQLYDLFIGERNVSSRYMTYGNLWKFKFLLKQQIKYSVDLLIQSIKIFKWVSSFQMFSKNVFYIAAWDWFSKKLVKRLTGIRKARFFIKYKRRFKIMYHGIKKERFFRKLFFRRQKFIPVPQQLLVFYQLFFLLTVENQKEYVMRTYGLWLTKS